MHRTDWITIVVALTGLAWAIAIVVTSAWRETWEWIEAREVLPI